MAAKVKAPAKRAYRSPRREEQAQQTRRAIRDAAERLFLEQGYAATSISAIAEAAGVATETVYAIFKNKRSLLLEIEDTLIVGDDQPVPLRERDYVARAIATTDAHERSRILSEGGFAATARAADFGRVMRSAADTDPEVAAIYHARGEAQYGDVRGFVGMVAEVGELALDFDDAVDLVYALSSIDICNRLVQQRGWTTDRYVEAMAFLLDRLLVDE